MRCSQQDVRMAGNSTIVIRSFVKLLIYVLFHELNNLLLSTFEECGAIFRELCWFTV